MRVCSFNVVSCVWCMLITLLLVHIILKTLTARFSILVCKPSLQLTPLLRKMQASSATSLVAAFDKHCDFLRTETCLIARVLKATRLKIAMDVTLQLVLNLYALTRTEHQSWNPGMLLLCLVTLTPTLHLLSINLYIAHSS